MGYKHKKSLSILLKNNLLLIIFFLLGVASIVVGIVFTTQDGWQSLLMSLGASIVIGVLTAYLFIYRDKNLIVKQKENIKKEFVRIIVSYTENLDNELAAFLTNGEGLGGSLIAMLVPGDKTKPMTDEIYTLVYNYVDVMDAYSKDLYSIIESAEDINNFKRAKSCLYQSMDKDNEKWCSKIAEALRLLNNIPIIKNYILEKYQDNDNDL